MSRRVRNVVAALFALMLVVQAPVATAAMTRDGGDLPRITERILRTLKKVLKPLVPSISEDDPEYKPSPPRP